MSKSILIVDDDKRLRELLEDYLSEKKYKIYLSEDFADAEEILEYFVFDLIIVDRMMPSGDGIDLIKAIKDKSNTPVILLTAMGEAENRIAGLKLVQMIIYRNLLNQKNYTYAFKNYWLYLKMMRLIINRLFLVISSLKFLLFN